MTTASESPPHCSTADQSTSVGRPLSRGVLPPGLLLPLVNRGLRITVVIDDVLRHPDDAVQPRKRALAGLEVESHAPADTHAVARRRPDTEAAPDRALSVTRHDDPLAFAKDLPGHTLVCDVCPHVRAGRAEERTRSLERHLHLHKP